MKTRLKKRPPFPAAKLPLTWGMVNDTAADEFFRIFGMVRVKSVRLKPRVVATKLVARKRTVR